MRRGRVQWLARPWFFVAIALLALNDHVLKSAWPGLVTGKLSDFAGLVVVATIVSVLLGPLCGTVLSGLAFVALKTIPGVAEVAAPLMGGGVTLRDASDLVALASLPPLWFVLARSRPDQRARNKRGWAAIGLIAAVLATTGEEGAPGTQVELGSGEGVIYARVDPGYGFARALLSSTDGGRNWVAAPDGTSVGANWDMQYRREDHEVCANDGTCYRLGEPGPDARGVSVERSLQGSDSWQQDAVLRSAYRRDSDLAVDPLDAGRAVALEVDRMVLYRRGPNDWMPIDLGPLVALPQWQQDLVVNWGGALGSLMTLLILGVAIQIVVPWSVARRRLLALDAVVFGLLMFLLFLSNGDPSLWLLQANAGWLGLNLLAAGAIRLAWRVEQRDAARSGSPPTQGSASAPES